MRLKRALIILFDWR